MLVLPAPAKINLYLHVTGKRADGYHELDTVFQLIDWQDTVRLQLRSDSQINLHTPIAGLPDDKHLAVRAARVLQQAAQSKQGVDLWVEKHIPSGAGLGGGSSDAASTLMGLNHLWQCGLRHAQLQALGLQLGADVPFFCSGYGTAHAQGIGEVLTSLLAVPKTYIVVYPNCHVSTPAVFKHPLLVCSHRTCPAPAGAIDPIDRYTVGLNAFSKGFDNDLQAPAINIAPAIKQAIDWLGVAPQCQGVRMSGSGSAVFAQFENFASAGAALEQLNQRAPRPQWRMQLVKPMLRHPALDFFADSV